MLRLPDADLRDTGSILDHAARALDFSQPVAVLLLAVLHFVPDANDPPGIVGALTKGLARASFVVVSHLTADFAPEAVRDAAEVYNKVVSTPVVPRSHAEVSGLFAGLPLVAPGVVPSASGGPTKLHARSWTCMAESPARRRGADEYRFR